MVLNTQDSPPPKDAQSRQDEHPEKFQTGNLKFLIAVLVYGMISLVSHILN
jgi:hypothetical protein